VAAVMLLVGAALFDTTLVVISRLRARRPILFGGTDHTSHRLLRLGLGYGVVDSILVAGTAYTAGLGVLVARNVLPALPALAGASLPALVGLILLLRVPAYEGDQEFQLGA
jgi:UDP-GlcNAc:undecaprenyl-phosphate GlcNAc-1-phosphate transferase